MADLAIKEMNMSKSAKTKRTIIEFYKKHGMTATLDAYGYSRSTIYRWQSLYHRYGINGLQDKGRSRHHLNKREWGPVVVERIRWLRRQYGPIGAVKLVVLLRPFCVRHQVRCPSRSTIARLIADDPKKMRFYPPRKAYLRWRKRRSPVRRARKPKGWQATRPGKCVAFDTIVFHINGCRRYVTH